MQKNWLFSISTALVVLLGSALFSPVQAGAPKVGRKAAARYFQHDGETSREASNTPASGGESNGEQLIMLSVGTFIGSKAYQWKGSDSRDNIGRTSYGVTYLMDQWHAMDVNLRADFNEYKLDDDHATKLSLMPLITFPQASSRFPAYFGIGVGLGVFFKQVPDESNLSLDYQLVAGLRFLDLFENFGFFVELAMKNHLHLLSDGQFNGTALTTGGVFTF